MENATTIGLDIAKSVFQVHGVDAAGEVVVRRKLTRGRVLGRELINAGSVRRWKAVTRRPTI
jgi:hypothetical protein